MFVSSKLTVLLSAVAGAMASTHAARSHHGRRLNDTLSKRETFSGRMTWYPTDTGPDACTGKNHQDSDWFVAMNVPQFDGSCGKQVKISYNGKSTVATCVDECASCPEDGQLDMTKDLFLFFTGDLGVGVFDATWSFVDGDGGDPPPPPPPTTHATPTTHHTTPKPTPTPTPTPTPEPAVHTTHHTTPTPKEDPTTSSTRSHTSSTEKTDSTSSARPSSSSAKPKPSSSVKPSSSSSADLSSISPASSPDPALPSGAAPGGVANVGSDTGPDPGSDSSDSDSGDDTTGNGISGALTGSSGVAAFGANTRSLAAAVLAIIAFNAL